MNEKVPPATSDSPLTIIVTGGSDGIGEAAVRQLHADGHHVVLVGRSPDKTHALGDELGLNRFVTDYARLSDVTELAADLADTYPRIDVLANNAGTMFEKGEPTADGFELHFQVNHLAPYLLTRLLLDRLRASSSTVVFTSSGAARGFGRLDPDRLVPAQSPRPMRAYASAKLAGLAFMTELHRRHHSDGLSTAAFHPGAVATNFGADGKGLAARLYRSRLKDLFLRSPAKGAEQLIWLAETTPGTDWHSGRYYDSKRPVKLPHHATDPESTARIWAGTDALLTNHLA